jgi:hypothetical protein
MAGWQMCPHCDKKYFFQGELEPTRVLHSTLYEIMCAKFCTKNSREENTFYMKKDTTSILLFLYGVWGVW